MEVEDRLSGLPDEVLVSILSELSMEEAMATSSLSSRWRYVWMHVSCLNFNRPKLPKKVQDRLKVYIKEVTRYINLVNHVLDLHKCPVLEEFSISFPFVQSTTTSTSNKCDVYKWLKFGSSRKIQCLKLDFSVDYVKWPRYAGRYEYSFPIGLLFSFRALKKLTLNRVNVDSQAVETLLSSCPLLELLSITGSCKLYHLKVVGPSLKLKHLVIWRCPVHSLEIRNVVNLISITYIGFLDIFSLENVTSVLNLDIHLTLYGSFAPMIATNFTQLVMLSLVGDHLYMSGEQFRDFLFPTFNNLKRLMLRLDHVSNDSLIGITPLLEAAPYLQKFTIELHRGIPTEFLRSISSKTMKSPHQHLTEVQYRGYIGETNDVELATFLLENTLALETFVIDPCGELKDRRENFEETQRARDLAMLQLQPKVPQGVKLVIM